MRRNTRQIKVGNVPVGGGQPISIQSMTNTDTRDAFATLNQISALARGGCEIIRCAVPDMAAADALSEIVAKSPIPVIADIHFDYRLALRAAANGVAALRLNPGNIDDESAIRQVVEACGEKNIPIRVGANSGSVKTEVLNECRKKHDNFDTAMAEALTVSVIEQCHILERYGFTAIAVSLKSSSVPTTVAAYRNFSAQYDYPLHIGVTEAGTPARGIVKSAVGIGALLLDGIGDTIRVSLTGDPMEEVICGRRILESCGLREAMPEIVSCPTCGRTEIDLIGLANRVEELVSEMKQQGRIIHLKKIAVMGCAVNGPGEARDADIGIAGGKNKVAVFRFGDIVGTFDVEAGFEFLKMEILKSSSLQEKHPNQPSRFDRR